jgi:predicted secreted Zn-dependent protease
MKALKRHEQGHVDIALAAANKLSRSLQQLKRYRSCSVLERHAESSGQRVLRSLREKEDRYDAITNHGEMQAPSSPEPPARPHLTPDRLRS